MDPIHCIVAQRTVVIIHYQGTIRRAGVGRGTKHSKKLGDGMVLAWAQCIGRIAASGLNSFWRWTSRPARANQNGPAPRPAQATRGPCPETSPSVSAGVLASALNGQGKNELAK
jgi:hypothetical protein